MSVCEYCRGSRLTGTGCLDCGRFLVQYGECQIVCGTDSKTEIARVSITDKYMMIHRTSGGEKGVAASFGLVGVIAASALSKGTLYGYYDHKEIAKVIYPYCNKKYKKDNALKIVNKDGSDLILKSVLGGISMEKLAACFKVSGVAIDGSRQDYGNYFCVKPFVDKKTMGSRICPSAVSFVKPVKGNFYAEPVSTQPVSEQSQASAIIPVPEPKPVSAVKSEPPKKDEIPKVIYVPPAPAYTEKAEEIIPFSPPPVPEKREYKFCYCCGQKLGAEYQFCFKCGKAQ